LKELIAGAIVYLESVLVAEFTKLSDTQPWNTAVVDSLLRLIVRHFSFNAHVHSQFD
jgi:hypothetical protein